MKKCIICGREVTRPGDDFCIECGEAALEAWEPAVFRTRNKIARTLRNRRKELQLSIEDVAESAGIKPATLNRIENAKFFPGAKQLFAICNALKLEIVLRKKS